MIWTDHKIATAKRIMAQHRRLADAAAALSVALKEKVTRSALEHVLRNRALKSSDLLAKAKYEPAAAPEADRFAKLVEFTRKPIRFSELCDRLELPPRRAEELVLQARANGIKLHVEHDHVSIRLPEPIERVQETRIAPVLGEEQQVGVLSDTHLGSKYVLRPQLRDYVEYAYDLGVRDFLHPGDWLDGQYGHGRYEVTHVGIDAQTQDLFETLPHKPARTIVSRSAKRRDPGARYHGITGNHDHTFTAQSGVDAGEFIESYFRRRGRDDVKFYGNRGAYLKIRGAVVHLWHPRGGGAYARSYNLQKKIESYAAIKPQILLGGHVHYFCYVVERGVHGLFCPTFQAGQSEFSKSLTGASSIGGLILRWRVTQDSTIRNFSVEKRSYFEVEKVYEVRNQLDGEPVEDMVTEAASRPRRG